MLSSCDFIVCTLSSNVCKLAHEIQQQRFVDGSGRLHSLDGNWFQRAPKRHVQKAIFPHKASTSAEISFDIGDMITDITTHVNGFNIGKTLKSNQSGIYPSYKTLPIMKTSKFPTYPDAIYHEIKSSSLNEIRIERYSDRLGKIIEPNIQL